MAFVYVLRSGDEELFKIGRTRGDLEARIRQLATGNPHRLTLFDHIETEYEAVCETYLHRRLRSKRSGEGDAREFFALSAVDLRDALRDAREFLAEFVPKQREAERLAKEETNGILLKPGHREWELYRRLLEVRESEYSLSLDRALLENQLKLVIGKADGLEQVATWKSHAVKKFDEAAFKLAEPELFEAFVRASLQRKFRLQ
jgi:hypothetical protein